MNASEFLSKVLRPAMSVSWGPEIASVSPRAMHLLLAIAGQESNWTYRRQIQGPAVSFWQFELGGGIRGVLNHPTSALRAQKLCVHLKVPCNALSVYQAMPTNDVLGAWMARLLLLTDRASLPSHDDVKGSYSYYYNNWRPGKPHPETWAAKHNEARRALNV